MTANQEVKFYCVPWISLLCPGPILQSAALHHWNLDNLARMKRYVDISNLHVDALSASGAENILGC